MNDILEIDGIKLDPENKQFFQAAELVRNSSQNIIYLTGKAGIDKISRILSSQISTLIMLFPF